MTTLQLPIRTRLTLVFSGVLLIVLAISGALIYRGFAAQLDTVIDGDIAALAKEFVVDVESNEGDILGDYGLSEPEDSFAAILDHDGRVLARLGSPRWALSCGRLQRNWCRRHCD